MTAFHWLSGRQEPWRGDARCQQGEHSEPAGGCSLRGSGAALHGSVHGHPGGRGAELAAGPGGASQGSASECRYHSLAPPGLRRGAFFQFSHFRGATHTAQNHTSRLSRHIVTTQRGIVESAALQTCGQICGANPNSRCEHPVP